MSIFADPNLFSLPVDCMRNDRAVQIMRQTADRLEKRIERIKQISTMENFWKAPIERIGPDGKLTKEPFDPTSGQRYQSIHPIHLDLSDNRYEGPDTIEPRMKRAFYRYSEVAVKNGSPIPKFDSRWDGFRFRLKTNLTKWRLI